MKSGSGLRRSTAPLLVALAASLGTPPADGEPPRAPAADPVLVMYDFEEPRETGPDTFWIRQPVNTEVSLSRAFRVHGERSLRLREVPGNQDFAELLSYFDEVRSGSLYVQCYVLLADPAERFNIGLAGVSWFLSRGLHGQAVWIQTRDGKLVHRPGTVGDSSESAEEWQVLFEPRPFTWYFIDLVYDVDRGTYHLRIDEEGVQEPLVDLHHQSAWHGQAGSSVRYLSVIGDLEDQDRSDVFIDDLLIATDPARRQRPFVAPGRRQYFVESLALAASPESAAGSDDLLDATRRALSSSALDGPAADLIERGADEAFRTRDLALAKFAYQALAGLADRQARVLLKLADVAFLEGDHQRERELRERFYGRLRLEEQDDQR